MQKEISYQEKFQQLANWMPEILEAVKKDLRNEHLKHDVAFAKKYLTVPSHKVTLEAMCQAYGQAINDGQEHLAEFITHRWLVKHSDLYHFFAKELEKINPDFSAIETLEPGKARQIAQESSEQFGAATTYLFSVLNAVVFPKEVLKELETQAEKERQEQQENRKVFEEYSSVEAMKKAYEREITRLKDKFEKKLAGLERKYHEDTATLKKQIAQLQKKLG